METMLKGTGHQVTIAPESPVVVIGEKINPTGQKRLAQALRDRDMGYVLALADRQVSAGADVLDVNVCLPGSDDTVLLSELITILGSHATVPLCIDTPNVRALAGALPLVRGKPLVNSVTGEENSLKSVLSIVRDRGAAVIGLTMDERGVPGDAETRLAIAEKILERAAKIGIPAEDVVIDPLVMTVGADPRAALVTLRAVSLIRTSLGVNINLGASNVSFGLPDRQTINQAFLSLAIGEGANCVITDPAKLTLTIRAVDLLLGRDEYASRYIARFRDPHGAATS
jgi:5-methyltetrahydrofolate--homocysteine methyltransferase